MSIWNIEPDDWFRRYFPTIDSRRRGREGGGGLGEWFGDVFRNFDETQERIERLFDQQVNDFETKTPKELIREYETPEGGKVREVGPIVYGYSMTFGPDGRPQVREFGNVRRPGIGNQFISAEREPLADVTTTDKDVKVIIELPGISKENIMINSFDSSVEIISDHPQRKYRRIIDLPKEADIETARSTYNHGILTITFNKKLRPKGRNITVE
jgi:HSP20 family protein